MDRVIDEQMFVLCRVIQPKRDSRCHGVGVGRESLVSDKMPTVGLFVVLDYFAVDQNPLSR